MTGRLRQATALLLWGLVILVIGGAVGAGANAGQALNHAEVVVVFEDGRVESRCVGFEEEEISGAELLRRSGLQVVFSSSGGLGEAICRIGDTGCSNPGDCFCQCQGGACAYWSYFAVDEGEWEVQNVGASQRRVRDGDVDGWVWGSGDDPPPAASRACGANEPEPDPEPTARPDTEAPTERPSQSPAVATVEDAGAITVGPEPTVASEPTVAPDQVERDDEPEASQPSDAVAEPTSDGDSVPVGLIAFGLVAGVLALGIAGLVLRRRLSG